MTYELKECIDCKNRFVGANCSQRCEVCQTMFRGASRGRWNGKYYRSNAEKINEKTRNYQKTEQGKQVSKATKLKMKELYPEKIKAREKLNDAVKSGRIIKSTQCELCGEARKLEGHHPDYSKPLDVKWYCNRCHNLMEMSLSELIEACGELMPSVRLFCNFQRNEYGTQAQMQGLEDVVWYSTPEEAVAKLWLALNKKDEQ